jgi:hypothetical protein
MRGPPPAELYKKKKQKNCNKRKPEMLRVKELRSNPGGGSPSFRAHFLPSKTQTYKAGLVIICVGGRRVGARVATGIKFGGRYQDNWPPPYGLWIYVWIRYRLPLGGGTTHSPEISHSDQEITGRMLVDTIV